MAEVVANMSMSLDGFIEDSRGGVAEMFAWTTSSEVASTMPGDDREFRTAPANADYLREGVTHRGRGPRRHPPALPRTPGGLR